MTVIYSTNKVRFEYSFYLRFDNSIGVFILRKGFQKIYVIARNYEGIDYFSLIVNNFHFKCIPYSFILNTRKGTLKRTVIPFNALLSSCTLSEMYKVKRKMFQNVLEKKELYVHESISPIITEIIRYQTMSS